MTVLKPSLETQGGGAVAGLLVLPYVLGLVAWAAVLWAVERVRHALA